MARGYIYIIQEGNNKAFKVCGSSVTKLQTGNFRPLTEMYAYPVNDVYDARNAAHKELKVMAIEEGGGKGWFRGEYGTILKLVCKACVPFGGWRVLCFWQEGLQYGGGRGVDNTPGYIYIIQEGNNEVFKVGATKHKDDTRLKQIQPGNYRKLTFKTKYKVNKMSDAEDDAHNELGDLNIKKDGGIEWFKGNFGVIKNIVSNACRGK